MVSPSHGRASLSGRRGPSASWLIVLSMAAYAGHRGRKYTRELALAESTRRRDEGLFAAINVTPLVDITLVLLIVFMVAAPLIVETPSIKVALPKAVTAEATKATTPAMKLFWRCCTAHHQQPRPLPSLGVLYWVQARQGGVLK